VPWTTNFSWHPYPGFDVLEQVGSGMAWESIVEDWHESITQEAIKEAVDLASQALLKHADEFILRPATA